MKALRVPHEACFVHALALAVEPVDTLALLMEIRFIRICKVQHLLPLGFDFSDTL